MEEHYPCPKMNFRQKVANFWYYYKWFVIVGSFFVAFLLIATVQYIAQTEADVSVLCVGSYAISQNECDDIANSIEKYLLDTNGDGKVKAEIKTYNLYSDYDLLSDEERKDIMKGNEDEAQEVYQSYSAELLSGDCSVLILDEYFYQELAENGSLVNLYEVYGNIPEDAFDYYGIRLENTRLYKQKGFSSLPKNMVICLKYPPAVSNQSDEQRLEQELRNIENFKALLGL